MSDTTTPISLPKDVADCHALIEQLAETVNEQAEKIESLSREKEDWRLAYSAILQARFRRRAERYVQDPNQLKLDFGDTPEVADAAEGLHQAVAESEQGESEQGESEQAEQEQTVRAHTRRRRAKPRQEKLPEHLPRYKVDAAVPESLRQCPVHGEREVIGYDEVETLELKRPELRVRVTRYPKFACSGSAECGVGSPERPAGLVEGNRYDTSVAAEVITGKYGYHLPTYRQQDYFAGSGWAPSRSTLLNLLRAAGELIRPLAEHFKAAVLGDGILGTDDTPVTLLLPKEIPKPDADDPRSVRACEVMSKAIAAGKPSITARMWVYRSATVPLNVFDFTVSRHRDGPEEFLKNYRGKLMADCYSGYQAIAVASSGQIERGACAAHARRKVFETRQSHPLEASVVLAKFQQLYDIEDRAKTFSDQQRLALRQAEAVPVWASLGEWLRSKAANDVLPKSRFGEALGYLRNHFEPLQLYLTDGRMPIDNNDAEQLMKQVALGRKNWLFIGSLAAGVRAADLMTLVSSAVRNDLDVWAYVKDVLDRLLLGTTDLDSLRPDVWRCAHPEAIRQYRTIERRDRADRKQRRRARRRAHPRR